MGRPARPVDAMSIFSFPSRKRSLNWFPVLRKNTMKARSGGLTEVPPTIKLAMELFSGDWVRYFQHIYLLLDPFFLLFDLSLDFRPISGSRACTFFIVVTGNDWAVGSWGAFPPTQALPPAVPAPLRFILPAGLG